LFASINSNQTQAAMLLPASLGLLIDIPLGVVIHRGGFCMHSGFRQVLKAERSSSFFFL
jgi:hypothetical protein